MTHAVILRRKAEDDIRTVLRWYETQNPTLGDQFLIELRRTLEQIGQFPESSPVVRKNVRRALVQRFPYLVFYVAESTRVVILAVLHNSRDPAVWPKR